MVDGPVECYLIKLIDKLFTTRRRTVNELKYLTRIITILCVSIESISKNECIMERSIIYKYKNIFTSSNQVNKYLKRICTLINVCKSDLNISNSNRGLICSLSIKNNDFTSKNISKMSIDANYILVVEKQSIFHYLTSIKFYNILPCILITGSGFPSFDTRNILNKIITNTKLAALYLGDYDPYGMLIYLTYIEALDCDNICCFKYLGVTNSDLKSVESANKVKLTNNDKRMIDMLIVRLGDRIATGNKLKQMLVKMKESSFKVEIEALQSICDDFLENYITKKALRNDTI